MFENLKTAQSHGITAVTTLISILHLAQTHGSPVSLSEVAKAAGVSTAAMTGIADKLEKANIVTRQPAAHDRRVYNLTLTENGLDITKSILG